jgi:hypothetical protein
MSGMLALIPCTLRLLLADCVHGIAYHALKLICSLSFDQQKMFPSQPCEQGIISTYVACLLKDKLRANQEIFHPNYLDLLSLY